VDDLECSAAYREGMTTTERRGRLGVLFAGVWLLFLVQPFLDLVGGSPPAWQLVLGVLLLVAFVVVYLAGVGQPFRQGRDGRGWVYPALLLAIALALLPLCGESALSTLVFVAVAAQATLPLLQAVVASLGVTALSVVLTERVPGWSDQASIAISILAASMAMFGVVRMAERNRALLAAQEEQARLVVLEERERMARDLHDILGHSLTVIAKKAELARRLTSLDPERAAAEIAEVERLSREALRDVRATVTGSRQVTLAGELASATNALASARIRADLPADLPSLPPDLDRLFGFALREAVTNVLRHSGAQTCTVTVTPYSLEVVDDGRGRPRRANGAAGHGSDAGAGNGLAGLRERVAAVGGRLLTESPADGGFRLRVELVLAPTPV
jgi:two-component system sensor histidine kinase DesK